MARVRLWNGRRVIDASSDHLWERWQNLAGRRCLEGGSWNSCRQSGLRARSQAGDDGGRGALGGSSLLHLSEERRPHDGCHDCECGGDRMVREWCLFNGPYSPVGSPVVEDNGCASAIAGSFLGPRMSSMHRI